MVNLLPVSVVDKTDLVLVYHFTKLLVYRPFLLLCLELKRRGLSNESGSGSVSVITMELADAATVCIDSARAIIKLSDSLFSLQIGVEVRTPFFSKDLLITFPLNPFLCISNKDLSLIENRAFITMLFI